MADVTISQSLSPLLASASVSGRSYKEGEIVRAIVAEGATSGRTLLLVADYPFEASTKVVLEPGEVIFLRVVGEEDGKLRLQLVQREGANPAHNDKAQTIKHLFQTLAEPIKRQQMPEVVRDLSKTGPLPAGEKRELLNLLRAQLPAGGTLERVEQLFSKLPAPLASLVEKLQPPPLGETAVPVALFKETIASSGVLLESAIADLLPAKAEQKGVMRNVRHPRSPQQLTGGIDHDLKGKLLRLQEILTSEREIPGIALAERQHLTAQVEGLLRETEVYQLLSLATGGLHTFFPFHWPTLSEGEIAFKGPKGKSRGYRCRLNLDLQDLGNLTIFVLMEERQLFITFRPSSSKCRQLIEDNLDGLREACSRAGQPIKAATVIDSDDCSLEMLDIFEDKDDLVSIKV